MFDVLRSVFAEMDNPEGNPTGVLIKGLNAKFAEDTKRIHAAREEGENDESLVQPKQAEPFPPGLLEKIIAHLNSSYEQKTIEILAEREAEEIARYGYDPNAAE